MQRIIGLTGGISTGKSTVAKYLAEHHHLPVFDADLYARQAVAPGTPGLAQIVGRYGQQILLPDGNLDRPQLGAIIFHQPAEKSWLESVIHPYVRDCFVRDIGQSTHDIVVAVIPLLYEANLQNTVTEVWVVKCNAEQQLARLQHRDLLTREQAQVRIDSQMPLETKVQLADVVLDNSGAENDLWQQIDRRLSPES